MSTPEREGLDGRGPGLMKSTPIDATDAAFCLALPTSVYNDGSLGFTD